MRRVTNQSSSSPSLSQTTNFGCAIAAGLPFFLGGAFVIEQSIFGRVDKASTRLGMAGFGSLFAVIGGGIMLGAVYAIRAARRRRDTLAAHPGEPWLVNKAWTQGKINDDAGGTLAVLWLF